MEERRRPRYRFLAIAAAAILIIAVVAFLLYKSRFGPRAKGVGLLASPPREQIKFSDYQPQQPLTQISPGVAAKTVFTTEENPQYRIEVQYIVIASGQRSANIPLQGTAVVEVLDGAGAASIGQNRQELKTNSIFAVAEGEALTIDNSGQSPLNLRMLVLKSR